MKQKYFIGIDVSKGKLDICVLDLQHKIILERIIKNDRLVIRRFLEKIIRMLKIEKHSILICCEHTGVYGRPLQSVATEDGYSLWVENPAKIKKASSDLRGKSDKKDALRIAEYASRYTDRAVMYKESSNEIKQLRALLSARETLLLQLNTLQMQIKETKKFDPEKYLVLKECYAKAMQSLKRELNKIGVQINEVSGSDQKIARNAQLLQSIPGIGQKTSLNFILATNNMENFICANQLACYAGVVPFPNQSGTITKRERLSNFANKKLKTLLHLAAMAAVKAKGELRAYYIRKVAEGKNKMSVLNAIRNKLVHRIFAVISRQTPYVVLQH